MADSPAPLTPADCNLQDFRFMPLDVQRLRDSDLAADETPEACWAAVLLWCVSWHQVPAASLPDDDEWLAKRAKYWHKGKIDKDWEEVRKGALRGWIKCSDDRLYHPVVAEKAREAWKAKHEQRYRTECGRIKKHNQRHGTEIDYPTFDEFLSPTYKDPVPRDIPNPSRGTSGTSPKGQQRDFPGDKGSKGQGEGQGQGQDKGKQPPIPPGGGLFGDEEKSKKRSPIALKTFLAKCKETGEKPISDTDPVLQYAAQTGIPDEFLKLHWLEFKARYGEEGAKRYKDWRAVFRKSVRGCWFRLWLIRPDGACVLTTVGEQAKRIHGRDAA